MQKAVENFQQKLALLTKSEKFQISVEPDITNMEKQHSSALTQKFSTLFLCLNWCCIIPYKIQYSDSDQIPGYKIVSNHFKKVLIWTVQVSISLYNCIGIFQLFKNDNSIKNLIRCTITLALACWSNVIMIVLWKNRHLFLRIMDQVDDVACKLEKRGAKFTKRRMGQISVTLLSTCCFLVSVMEATLFALQLHRKDRYLNPMLIMGEQTRALDEILPEFGSSALRTLLLWTVGCFHLVTNRLYFFTVGHFGYVILLIFCQVIGELYENLNLTIKKQFSSPEAVDEAINLYTTLRRLTTETNEAIGLVMAWGVLSHLPYNAYKVSDLIYGDIYIQLSYVVHITVYLAMLYAGAKVHSQINSFMDRLACDKLMLQDASLQAKVSLLVQQSRWAGMRGGGLFLLTYGFLGNIVGVILTYAILIVQFPHK